MIPRSEIALSLTLGALVAPGLVAGDVDPPGAPASTPGPEPRIAVSAQNTPGDTDSLFRISQPGSYYLVTNVTGVSGEHGVEIAADGVTLDLNGFEVVGVPGSLNGIRTSGGVDSLAIVNGSVRGWDGEGISLNTANVSRVENVIVRDNMGNGIRTGLSSVIRSCVARGNGGDGITTQNLSVVTECTASSNDRVGIVVGGTSLIDRCVASSNGDDGLATGSRSTIANCQSNSNTGDGIQVYSDCIVRDNACAFNGNGGDAAGVHTLNVNNRIEGNNVINNFSRGIDVDLGGNLVIRNSASNNGTLGAGNYAIAGGNSVGPIITGADPIASENPWANFAF